MTAIEAGTGRLVPGELDLIWMPRGGARGRRPVLLLHGQLQSGQEWNAPATTPQQTAITRAIAAADLAIFSLYAAGSAWGNDTALADIDTALAATAAYGCRVDAALLVGASMGGCDGWNYMRASPNKVRAFIGIMPASDSDDVRDANRASARDKINTAWGLPAGSTSATNPLPTRANPAYQVNADLIKTSPAITNGRCKLYYSAGDTVVIPSTVTALAAKVGVAATQVSATLDHSDGIFGACPFGSAGNYEIERILDAAA